MHVFAGRLPEGSNIDASENADGQEEFEISGRRQRLFIRFMIKSGSPLFLTNPSYPHSKVGESTFSQFLAELGIVHTYALMAKLNERYLLTVSSDEEFNPERVQTGNSLSCQKMIPASLAFSAMQNFVHALWAMMQDSWLVKQ